MNVFKADNRANLVVFGMVCALVIGIFCRSAKSGHLELASPRAEDTYYNLLVQGFRSGQLNVKREAPPELARLADPYDSAANAAYVWEVDHLCYEMSYYKGKLYLYFGVTPAVVLFWPYEALTGHYLLHKDAIMIFCSLGFLAAASLLYSAWRRYFSAINVGVVACGLLAMGLATNLLELLTRGNIYEVPRSCAFAFAMLALGAVWRALHGPKRQVWWTVSASLAYGLAIGARPSLLFGAIVLLAPAAQACLAATGPFSPRRIAVLLMAAVMPVTLVGTGLMIYNTLRFDSPFEFGWHYMLTDIHNKAVRQFSPDYLWFNLWFYFLEPVRWGVHFPFLQEGRLLPLPAHDYYGASGCCGILCNYPIVWLALAAPLAWKGRTAREMPALRWFIGAVFLLFAACGLTLCLFFAAGSGYLTDFLPALMLLAVVGILGLERALAGSPIWRRAARLGWCLLLIYSVAINVIASVKIRAEGNYFNGNSFFHQGRVDEAVDCFEKAVAMEPQNAVFHIGLGNAYVRKGMPFEAMAHFQKALEIEPTNAEAQYDLGCTFMGMGQPDEAIRHFQEAFKSNPDFAESQDPVVNNNFAWSLATNPEPGNRNGAIAVIMAEGACRKTHYQQATMVGTLAAAYAEAGRFDDAVATAQKARDSALALGQKETADNNERLMELYKSGRAFHEAAAAAP